MGWENYELSVACGGLETGCCERRLDIYSINYEGKMQCNIISYLSPVWQNAPFVTGFTHGMALLEHFSPAIQTLATN